MGELTTIDTSRIIAMGQGFLRKAQAVREAVRTVSRNFDSLHYVAMAEAQLLIRESMTDADQAALRRWASKGKLLIEGSKDPSKVDIGLICDVVAEAEAMDLELCSTQYSVWANGKLYIKENGYRRLFALHPECGELRTNCGTAEWVRLKNRNCWQVPVKGSVIFNGQLLEIERVVGVNGYDTDGIAKICAHAERELLKSLWKLTGSAVATDRDGLPEDDEIDSSVGATVIEPTRLQQAESASIDDEKQSKAWAAEFKTHGVMTQAKLILEAPTIEDAAGVLRVAKQQIGESIDQRAYDCLDRYYKHKWGQ
jgi:hypothetical protein